MQMHNPPHPGCILAACFDETRTVEDSARHMGLPVTSLTDIIAGRASITPDIAILLSTVLTHNRASIWLKLQERYDAWQVDHNQELRAQVLARHHVQGASNANV